jgi:cysteine desulfurase
MNRETGIGIYLDHNGTTAPKMPKIVSDAMTANHAQGNPSATYALAKHGQHLIEDMKAELLKLCGTNNQTYKVIPTSGACEANNYIIHGAITRYCKSVRDRNGAFGYARCPKPAIIMSSIEHKTSIQKADELELAGQCIVYRVHPHKDGRIYVADIIRAIDKAGAADGHPIVLVTIISANNETGICNNICAMAKECAKRNILFHTDITAQFGKYAIDLNDRCGIGAVSLTFHKFYGPVGIGALIIRCNYAANAVVTNNKDERIPALIAGTQYGGLRGGTENVALAAGALAAMRYNFAGRDAKNKKLSELRAHLIRCMRAPKNGLHVLGVTDELFANNTPNAREEEIIIAYWNIIDAQVRGLQMPKSTLIPNAVTVCELRPNTVNVICINLLRQQMPHIISCAFFYGPKPINRIAVQSELQSRGVIVSTGSACSMNNYSYVLRNMNIPSAVAANPIRITIGDTNTMEEMSTAANIIAQSCKHIVDSAAKKK